MRSPIFYGNIETSHFSDSYFDDGGYSLSQPAYAESKLRIGLTHYNGSLDLYGTVGVIKKPQTQMLVQRRPEIELDLSPIKNSYGGITFYGILELPFSEDRFDSKNANVENQGSILTLGLAPYLDIQHYVSGSRVDFKIGADASTRLYSRRQYIDSDDEILGDASYFLTAAEPIEETLSPFETQGAVGFGFLPGFFRSMYLRECCTL